MYFLIHFRRLIILVLAVLPGFALGFSLSDGAEAYTNIVETHHRLNNMYFYSALGLLMVTIPAVSRLRQGEALRPALSRSIAWLVKTVNLIVICFLAIHFMPETEIVFDWTLDIFARIFS